MGAPVTPQTLYGLTIPAREPARRELMSLPDILRTIGALIGIGDGPRPKAIALDDPRHLALVAEVDRAVQEEVDRRETAARGALVSAVAVAQPDIPPAQLAAVVSQAVEQATVALSPARTLDNARRVTNAGFGAGRGDAEGRVVGAIGPARFRGKVYSAVMDGGTCPECAKWDGVERPLDYGSNVGDVNAPNARCEGTLSRCRCVWMLVANGEGASRLPVSTPQPVGDA